MVFYRKYRPQKIAELDSEEIREKLYSAFSDLSSVSHAFLFTGPKGLGKTSTARIVAKVVNCQEKSKTQIKNKKLETKEAENSIEPCNKCDQCVSITNGTNLDVLEIDGASNRGIDEIRDLREKIRLAPISASKKVYIIDEVHMLTTEAFNALLKTLEEPPNHVIFILCTTEPHKVPETIISRCSHIHFKLATNQELLNSFRRIAKGENLDINEDALLHIASMSDGSFRDGAKILEEVVVLSQSTGGKITKEVVEEKYQISNIKYQKSKLLGYLEKKDTKSSLQLISELVEQGVDMKFFIEKLVEELHSMLLIQAGVESSSRGPVIGFPPVNAPAKSPRQAGSNAVRVVGNPSTNSTPLFSIRELKNLIELFTKAYGELKYAVLPSIPLELAVIEWGQKEESTVSSVGDSSSLASSQNDIWHELINKVKTHNHSIAGILRGCSLKSLSEKELVIEAKYKFHKDKLSEKKAMEVLEKVIKEITGKSAKIEVVLKK